MKKRLLDINEQVKRITDLYEGYEKTEEELIRNIVKGIELDKRLDHVKKLLEGIESELKKDSKK